MHKSKNTLYLLYLVSCILLNSSCKTPQMPEITPGVSMELAQFRSKYIQSVHYKLSIEIPPSKEEKVTGHLLLEFELAQKLPSLSLDFNAPDEHMLELRLEGEKIDFSFYNEHIIIPGKYLQKGFNQFEISFISTDQALNRQNEFMYTLFVPDRASTAFPCFDQPDLKAKFLLQLTIPEEWKAVSNGACVSETITGNNKHIVFSPTAPLPTYLFSFAAGMFDTLSAEKNGRLITMYHRETDKAKLKNNANEIFNQHFAALEWMGNYTGIEYPYGKFDFVVIPFFQYGGMEHPGAILYREARLFLDENASQGDLLARANLIAHETAHMWFGDLVTMRWFNDVWMKEVFANFLADKIVNPMFPELNHRQRFLFTHFPRAYEIDRTKGANPIRQDLDNMKNAGTLYGNIIYHKAPIMMNQLEKVLGEKPLKKGLQKYLKNFFHGNADWPELIDILDGLTELDLKKWSRIWVEEPGMPVIAVTKTDKNIILTQTDLAGQKRIWSQIISPLIVKDSISFTQKISFLTEKHAMDLTIDNYDFILPDASAEGYGYFRLDEKSLVYLLSNYRDLDNPMHRAISILLVWEEMLNGRIEPTDLFNTCLLALQIEEDPLNTERILQQVRTLYWKFLKESQREKRAARLEDFMLNKIAQTEDRRLKNEYFRTFVSVSSTEKGLKAIYDIWAGDAKMNGIDLTENDFIRLSMELAVKLPGKADKILEKQLSRIINKDRKEGYLFVLPALSPEKDVRDRFFESLKLPENRKVEPWVLQALEYLHHPLRTAGSIEYLRPSLELLTEIQLTGDIFFPTNWLNAILGGHQSSEAKQIVEGFLNDNHELSPNLRGKVLQSADLLFRTVEINKKPGKY